MLDMPGVPETNEHVEPRRWFYAKICQNASTFYDALTEHLCTKYPHIEGLASVCQYQKSIVVLPNFDPNLGSSVPIDHDWPEYFARPETRIPTDLPQEPHATPNATLQISDTGWDDGTGRAKYNWTPGDHHETWHKWFHTIATNRLSATKCNHQSLHVTSAQPVATQR